LQTIRPIPDSSHTAGVGAANRMFSIGKIWHREKRTVSKLSIEDAESFTPAGNFHRARDVPLSSREL
jgi:hypothetical protein